MQVLFYNRYIFCKYLKFWSYGQDTDFFFKHLLLLDLQGKVAIIKSL